MAKDWLTVNDAAELVGYHADYIRRLVRSGSIRAEKFGPVWKVDKDSLLAFIRSKGKLGEKRGPKPKH